MSRADDARLGLRMGRALRTAGVLRPVAPGRLRAAVRAGRTLHATPAASVAINAALDPAALAVADERGTLTWATLDTRARAVGAAFAREHGAGADRCVAILCRNHRGLVEALAGAAHAGADVLLLNTEMPGAQLAQVLDSYPISVVVCDDEFAARLDDAARPVARVRAWCDTDAAAGTSLDDLAATGAAAAPPARRSRIVILTSGTTGVPRGAARDVPPRAMAGPLLAMVEDFGLRRAEPVLVAPPLFHGFGLGVAMAALGLGAPLVLRRRFDAAATLAAIAEHRAGVLLAVPVMLKRILETDPALRASLDRSSLRGVVSAGAPLPPALATAFMDAFGDVLCNGYGTTETGFGAYATPADLRAAPGTIGRPPYGTTLRILDEDRRPVAPGTTGHIFIGGDLVFDGYVGGGDKERTGGLTNTGDLGHVDAAGRVFVDGREDDMIVSGGENVFPQEVEDALAAHPAVSDVAVLGVEDAEFGQRLRAFVVPADGAPPDADALAAHLRERLERYKLPREIVFCDEIPRTATGKVLRRALAQP